MVHAAGGVSGDATAGGGCGRDGMVVVAPSCVSFRMNAGMTLSVNTVIALSCTEQLEHLVCTCDDSVGAAEEGPVHGAMRLVAEMHV